MKRQFAFALLVIALGLLLAGAISLLIPESAIGSAWAQLLVLAAPLALCVLLVRYLPLQLESKYVCFIALALLLLATRGYYENGDTPKGFRVHVEQWLYE